MIRGIGLGLFQEVNSRVSFPAQEQDILALWKELDVFKRSVEERPIDNKFIFYEGPPTANGNPGIHHVLARAFKDLIPRYRTMRGYRVPRKGGWDTHGLPVELEVEKQLGLKEKKEIESFGVEEFNRRCRESVFNYVQDWERLTDRIGYWVDMSDPYVTYDANYVESCWWIFKRLWDNGLMFQDFRVTPHCPRCQTSLSSHEISLGYKEDTPDPGVTIRFVLPSESSNLSDESVEFLQLGQGIKTSLLAWTTTPWTLSGSAALAVSVNAEYSLVEREDQHIGVERIIVATDRVPDLAPDGEVLARFKGASLLDAHYEELWPAELWDDTDPYMFVDGVAVRPASLEDLPNRKVVASDEVTTDEGTGILHVAPAFGAEDYGIGRANDLMFLQPVRPDGVVLGGPGDGLFAKDADKAVTADLRQRGLLFKSEQIRHTYPFCWRCDQPILYYAKPSWYIRTTAVRDDLVSSNQRIGWVPNHIKDGRFGEWLSDNVDWAVSRERYWGTPLPIWSCEACGSTDAVGSFDELFERAIDGTGDAIRRPSGEIDPHRPFVDDVIIGCSNCGGRMNRTPEVADAWFDSGAMPYAQHHYPFENEDVFAEQFPADFICEAVDQTRGWFYTLHALATLLHSTGDTHAERSFENVICLGHILDGEGSKMSKSVGNVINPWSVLDDYGADAVRWTMYTASPPGNSRRFSADLVQETSRKFLSTLWNTYSFFVTYANTGTFNPADYSSLDSQVPIDRWIRSELEITVSKVTSALDAYEPAQAAHPIASFVDQLSNWYVRRNRRRFWKSGDDEDSRAALATLYHCLTTVSKLLAPFTPFIAETIYQNLERSHSGSDIDSVHLNYWPVPSEELIDEDLSRQVSLVQKMISLGRAAREQAKVKVRQPCATVVLIPRNPQEREALAEWTEDIAAELNVKTVEVLDDPGDRVHFKLKPNLQILGPRFGKNVSVVKSAIESADSGQIIESMKLNGSVTLGEYDLTATEILVDVEASDGWSAQEDGGYLALLETRLDEALVAEGLAREIVRRLQNLRRDAGFDISDRINISWSGSELISSAMSLHLEYIADETLALEINEGDSSEQATSWSGELDGEAISLGVELVHSD